METIKQRLRRALGQRQDKGTVLWPKVKKRPRVLYETDTDFHAAYDRALVMTQVRDIALRQQ